MRSESHPRPVGRPKNLEMRRCIVAAATLAFAERGFFGASMRDIALRVDITEGRLYRYFAHKAALLDAIAAEAVLRSADLLEAVEAFARDHSALRDFLESYAALCIDDLAANHDWYALWLQRPPISEGRALELSRLAEDTCHVVAGKIAKHTRNCDAVLLATVLSSAIFTQVIFRHRVGVAALSDDLAKRLVDGWLAIVEH